MVRGFSRKRVYQCSYGWVSAYVGGQNLLTSDVIYQLIRTSRALRVSCNMAVLEGRRLKYADLFQLLDIPTKYTDVKHGKCGRATSRDGIHF